ncbi:uncharacterized protein LOC142897795 [Nelusetta ayraudi]|uniref:uncharacterized protein LOC142897795 n=1 Tax=Nelusetta ayraudi TaxID=303726 RepID=UPI003F6FBC14
MAESPSPKREPETEVFSPRHGTGRRRCPKQGLCSLLTDKRCRVVAPAQHPDKKTVFVVASDQLANLVSDIVTIPEERLSFGFVFVCGGKISDFKTEVLHAVVPRTPDAVCMCAPGYNHRQSIPKNVQDFEELLSAVCYRWPKVFVLDFPTDLMVEPILQNALRKEYCRVCESVGIAYMPVANQFPSHRLELWCRNGVRISAEGAPVLLQLLRDAAEQQLAVFASLSEMSVVGQCEVEETSPQSVAVSGAPLPAEPQASCQASSPTGMSDAPVISGGVSTPVNANHPETTASVQLQHLVNGCTTPVCPHPDILFGPSRPKRLKKRTSRFRYDMTTKACTYYTTVAWGSKHNSGVAGKLMRRQENLRRKREKLNRLEKKISRMLKAQERRRKKEAKEMWALRHKLAEQKLEIQHLQCSLNVKKDQIKLLKKELQMPSIINSFSPESLLEFSGPGHFYYCTGFTYDQFNSLCVFFHSRESLQRHQILLTLMKLRLNMDHNELASRFEIDPLTVSVILNNWVDYMYDQLSQLSTWPHRDTIFQNMPEGFKEDFPNTFAILDLVELKIELKLEGPDLLHPVALTYDNTLKSLIACDPRGVVMYVSDLFPGSWSGQEIFQKCDIEKLLQGCIQCGYLNVGDGLMVDKSLSIQNEVENIGLRMNIPPIDRVKPNCDDTKMSQIFAEHLIHTERAGAEIRRFQILSDMASMSQLGNANHVWHVVSMLSNLVSHNLIK